MLATPPLTGSPPLPPDVLAATDGAAHAAHAPPLGTRRRRLALAAAVVLPWLALGLIKATESYTLARLRGEPRPFLAAWREDLPIVLVGAAMTPLALWLALRFPVTRESWRRNLPVLAVAAVALISCMNVARTRLWQLTGGVPDGLQPLLREAVFALTAVFHIDLTVVVLVMGTAHLAMHVRERQAREVAAARLEAQLADARLRALRMQLNPHFLFNALNTVAQLVRTARGAEAVRVTEHLGDLLRAALDDRRGHLVPLEEEVEFARTYLRIEQVRFSDRLRTEWEVDREATRGALVPCLILQPLVENAVRHGIAPVSAAGRVEVRIGAAGGRLRIEVGDDGRGLPPGWRPGAGEGVGLANTRERLRQLYGGDFALSLEDRPGGGAVARVEIPLRTERRAWTGSAF